MLFQSEVLLGLGGKTAMDSTRRTIRRIMSKDLAKDYSLTGLGASRKNTKKSFREHAAAKFCFGESLILNCA